VQSSPAGNDHHAIGDPEINLASIAKNDLPQHPADKPAQLDDNGLLAVTDGAHPTHPHFDVNQVASFKFADDGTGPPGHAIGKDTSVQSSPAGNDHHAIGDPEIDLASIAKNDLPQHPADKPAQLDDNGLLDVTDGAHPAHPHSDVNQLDNFKFADNGSAHPDTVPYDPPALATPSPANSAKVPGTVMSDAASDQFIFGKGFVHNTVSDVKPDMIETDHNVIADIQHLLHTAHDTNVVSALDPNHTTAPQDMTKVQLPHHYGDFHFA
jgi:hypothetical protein